MGDVHHLPEVVADVEGHHPGRLSQAAKPGQDRRAGRAVEARDGLVQQERRGAREQRARQ